MTRFPAPEEELSLEWDEPLHDGVTRIPAAEEISLELDGPSADNVALQGGGALSPATELHFERGICCPPIATVTVSACQEGRFAPRGIGAVEDMIWTSTGFLVMDLRPTRGTEPVGILCTLPEKVSLCLQLE